MSLTLPFFSLAVPLVWSERPSDFLALSPVTAPAASLALPLALSSAPSPLSWPLLFLPMQLVPFLRFLRFHALHHFVPGRKLAQNDLHQKGRLPLFTELPTKVYSRKLLPLCKIL